MTISFFLTFHDKIHPERRLSDTERAFVVGVVRATPDLAGAVVHTPASAKDPYLDDGPSPQLVLQLHFAEITLLERVLRPGGHLHALATPSALPSLVSAEVTQQAMLARAFAVPDPTFRTPAGSLACSYLVGYPGPAADLNAWQHHYLASHVPVMARFPGIRRIEVHTRIDWIGFLPWPRANLMLRNRVVFDDSTGLAASLASPVRDEMRADYRQFPSFEGDSTHYPLESLELRP